MPWWDYDEDKVNSGNADLSDILKWVVGWIVAILIFIAIGIAVYAMNSSSGQTCQGDLSTNCSQP